MTRRPFRSLHPITLMNLSLSPSCVSAGSVQVGANTIAFDTNKAGTGLVLVSKKTLGRTTGLKGAALNRAHFEYRVEAGKALNAGLASKMAGGELLAQKIIPTKHGFTVGFATVATMKSPSPKKSTEVVDKAIAALIAAGLTVEQAKAALA